MSLSLFGNSYGYEPEQRGFGNLNAIVVKQGFEGLVNNGVSQNPESTLRFVAELHERFNVTKLGDKSTAIISRKCEDVGVNFKAVMEELVAQEQLQQAKFRNENLRPSFMPKPGR